MSPLSYRFSFHSSESSLHAELHWNVSVLQRGDKPGASLPRCRAGLSLRSLPTLVSTQIADLEQSLAFSAKSAE